MSRRNNQSRSSQSHDMFQSLLNNPIPSPGNSSTGSPQTTSHPTPNTNIASGSGFAGFSVNPFSQQFYQQTGFPAVPPHFLQAAQFNQPSPQMYQPQYNQPPPQSYQPPSNQPTTQNIDTPTDYQPEFESEAEDEVAVDVSRKGKAVKRKVTKWTADEAVILAQRWIGASENPSIGRSQSDAEFWRTIVTTYNSLVDEHRTKSQLQGKWNKIRTDVKIFGAIFKKYEGAGRPSGADDKAVYDAAKAHFLDQNGRHFLYEGCWHELKDFPKFWTDYNVRNQQPSHLPTQDPISLDDDEPAVNPTSNRDQSMASLFRDDPIRRPPGRGISRKSQRSGSSSDAATSSRYSSDETRDHIAQTHLMQQEALKSISEAARQTGLAEAFRVLNTPITEGLSKREKKMLAKAKEKMMAKFQDVFGADDEDEDEDEDDDE